MKKGKNTLLMLRSAEEASGRSRIHQISPSSEKAISYSIIVFGDHGEQFFERGNGFGHGKSLFPEEIKVPLIVFIPGKGNQDRTEVVSLVDIFPTLAKIMKLQYDHEIDGFPLPLEDSSKQVQNRFIYYEVTYGESMWGIQNHEFKLVVDGRRGKEYFYDLRKDPLEQEDLASQAPGPMKGMKDLLSFVYSEIHSRRRQLEKCQTAGRKSGAKGTIACSRLCQLEESGPVSRNFLCRRRSGS